GIETPSAESLKQTRKLQNLKLPLQESVLRLTHAGLEVYAGFIVGFDTDGEHIFEAQRTFIDGLPIAAAMIGLLTALPNTALRRHRRSVRPPELPADPRRAQAPRRISGSVGGHLRAGGLLPALRDARSRARPWPGAPDLPRWVGNVPAHSHRGWAGVAAPTLL